MVPIGVIALSDIINELTLFGSMSGNVIVIPPPPEVPQQILPVKLFLLIILDSYATGPTSGIQNE